MKKRALFLGCILSVLASSNIWGAPARPGRHSLKQPDGKELTAVLKGDEHFHYWETTDGIMLQQRPSDGYWCYAVLSDSRSLTAGPLPAVNPESRSADDRAFISGIDQAELRKEGLTLAIPAQERRKATRPGAIKKEFPTTGTVRGIVVLAEYQDIKFSTDDSNAIFSRLVNEKDYSGEYASGSIRDYFTDQSNGKFTVDFDVVGPVTLSNDREYYGGGSLGGEKVPQMIEEAVTLAYDLHNLDFSSYDSNDDGFVDFIYVIYAGHGEAQGGPAESVWPQAYTLEYDCWKTFDGLYLGNYACSCELRGASGTDIDGIGTFCHEFGHILGLPDVYDVLYSGYYGMNKWDIMDVGSYNNDSKTPAGYNAFEKYSLGWLEPTVLEESATGLKLNPFSKTNEAFFIVSEQDNDEYFILENRQPHKWDSALPGHGMLAYRINYNEALWKSNKVNTSSAKFEHIRLIPADGVNAPDNLDGDTFPGATGVTSFSGTNHDFARWHDETPLEQSLSNITEQGELISFDFNSGSSAIRQLRDSEGLSVSVAGNRLSVANPAGRTVRIVAADGTIAGTLISGQSAEISLPAGFYIATDGQESVKFIIR